MKIATITTPIYYVNDVPHIGHAYTTVAADVWARWKRLKGERAFFLTGTDEHGDKIAQAAAARGETPKAYADRIVEGFRGLWKILNIASDDFIRTTEPRHEKVVQGIFEKMKAKGDIVKGVYEDWYCVPDETFFSTAQLADGKCPDCGRPVEKLREESYFFRLESYKERLLAHYRENPGFLQPPHRAAEIVNFVKELKDLSVSRTKVKWGIPVPSDPGHTVYVWFDALINYVSALGYDPSESWEAQAEGFRDRWPAAVHLVGKEIFRFHTVIWPAMLMSLGLPLPGKVFAHGWWTVEGEKMSKSRGNVVDPAREAAEFGVDALRYFLLREVPFGSDGDFSRKGLLGRYNSELANALGNLLNRTLNLLEKNHGGQIPDLAPSEDLIQDLRSWTEGLDQAYDRLAFHEALQKVMDLVDAANRHVNAKEPWKLVKTDPAAAARCLYEVARLLKLAAVALAPVMPTIAEEMWKQLGEAGPISAAVKRLFDSGDLTFLPNQKISKGSPLFPRKDEKIKN
jgi:methionyl-tRNA synthetase